MLISKYYIAHVHELVNDDKFQMHGNCWVKAFGMEVKGRYPNIVETIIAEW